MAKRFTDTDKWRKPWFRSLNGRAKIVWIYLTDNCDHAGFWPASFDLLSLDMGFEVSDVDFAKWYGDRVQKCGDKFFVPAFVEFQYGELNPQNRVHKSVLQRLEKEKIKPLTSPIQGAKDKDKDKDKDKEGGAGETISPEVIHPDRAYTDLAATIFTAVRSHPAGDPAIANAVGVDWFWVSASGLMNTFRQAKDDDFSRKRLASDLKSAHERFLKRPAPFTLEGPPPLKSSAESFESGASETPVSSEKLADIKATVAKRFGVVGA